MNKMIAISTNDSTILFIHFTAVFTFNVKIISSKVWPLLVEINYFKSFAKKTK
jgi:hypothetical protein